MVIHAAPAGSVGRKLPAEIAEDVLLNASDVELLCCLPAGSLQNKVLSFPTR